MILRISYKAKNEDVMKKKLGLALAVMATLMGNMGYAQSSGRAANAGRGASTGGFAWGIGLAGVAVIATVVGIAAASASGSPSTYSH